MLLLGWFLYPRELFLGFIYEGTSSLEQSQRYYTSYLAKHPLNRFATLRLAHVLERMGEPHLATPLLEQLWLARPKDLKTGEALLNHLRNVNDEEKLFQTELKMVRQFSAIRRFPKGKIKEILLEAYHYARWTQKNEEAYTILESLADLSKDPNEYDYLMEMIHLGYKQTEKVIALLKSRIQKNEQDFFAREDLIAVLMLEKNEEEAFKLIEEGMRLFPERVSFYKLKFALHQKQKDKTAMLKDLQTLLNLTGLSPEERSDFEREMASLYLETGKQKEALVLYRGFLDRDRSDVENWKNLTNALIDCRRFDEAVATFQEYLVYFPTDLETEKNLADLLLYEIKDYSPLAFYFSHVQKTGRGSFAMEIGYALMEEVSPQTAEGWIKKILPLFPRHFEMADLAMEIFIRQKKYQQALETALNFLKQVPGHEEATLRAANLYGHLFNRKKAIGLLQELAGRSPRKFLTLREAGKMLFLAGGPLEGMEVLHQASRLKADDPELLFWLSECYQALDQESRAKKTAQKIRDKLGEQKSTNQELERILLKSEARLSFNQHVESRYDKTLLSFPRFFDLHSDYFEILVDHRRFKKAGQVLDHLKKTWPEEFGSLTAMESRLLFKQRKWQDNIQLLTKTIETEPEAILLKKELAETFKAAKMGKSAVHEYEEVYLASDRDPQIAVTLKELHSIYDHRIGSHFRLMKLGDETTWTAGLFSKNYLSDHWGLEGEFLVDFFDSPSQNSEGKAERGFVGVSSTLLADWEFKSGITFGISSLRKTPGFFASALFEPTENWSFSSRFDYRQLNPELPQFLAAGNLSDTVQLTGTWHAGKRATLSGKYEFDRHLLPDGEDAFQHEATGVFSYLVLKKPNLSMGYQFSFIHVDAQNDYLTIIPLNEELRAHYLTGDVSHFLFPNLLWEGGFFLGEDTSRNLHFYEGDLWGLRTRMVWNILDWLDMEGAYDFGRETLGGISGESHLVEFGVSGHWN